MYAEFSPDGSKVAYVRNDTLYYTNLENRKEILVGAGGRSDWVYEEELELVKAFEWSPDSKCILYYYFNENNVKEYTLQFWNHQLYPSSFLYKYPKAGEQNSSINIYIYTLDSASVNEITREIEKNVSEEYYYPRAKFISANIVAVICLNRKQNKLKIYHYDLLLRKGRFFYEETNNKSYIEINDDATYLNEFKFFFTSEISGYKHIYIGNYNIKNSDFTYRPITKGNWEVEKIMGVDAKKKIIYYTSNEASVLETHLYIVDFSGNNKKKLTKEKGVHHITMSPNYQYFIDNYSAANTPPVIQIIETYTGNLINTLVQNEQLRKQMAMYGFSKQTFFTFITSSNISLNAAMILPPDFDKTKKYPVLLSIYGGPGHQLVKEKWGGYNFAWYQLLARKGYIIIMVDGRGTGGRGAEFKKCTQLVLGTYETEDLIETAKYLRSLKYVDTLRIGIFGWSYGGYLSTLAITKGADYFKTAIAVAPVTHWKYYDNIYTERYMSTPADNPGGYEESSPITYADKLKGNLLLIHGTADDNVHVQHTYALTEALIKANKQFELFIYPDKNHGIYGGNTRLHLYTKMTEFLFKNL
jgi:dipeptidyl-peptidase-4